MVIKGFTCSAFDLLHAGYISMLEEAKKNCDYLIVGLHTNPSIERGQKNKPIQTVFERFLQLKGCKFVDEIIPYDTEEDLLNLLNIIKPDVRFIGEEYKNLYFTGKDLDIKIIYNSRKHTYSSSELRERLIK